MRPARAALLLAVGALTAMLGVRAARATPSEWVPLDDQEERPISQRVRAMWWGAPSAARLGAYGFAAVRLQNPTAEPRRVEIGFEDTSASSGPFRASRQVTVAPESGTWVHLPLPAMSRCSPRLWARLAGGGVRSLGMTSATGSQLVGILGLYRGSLSVPQRTWRPVVERGVAEVVRGPSSGRGLDVEPWVDLEALPDDPVLLTGFDLILLTRPPSELTDPQQEALVDYVAMGGHLLVTETDGGGAGPLDAVLAARPARPLDIWEHRLGQFAVLGREHFQAERTQLSMWIRDEALRALNTELRPFGSGTPTVFWLPLDIPGLGEVPTRTFFFLLLLFAVFVGPLSYRFFKRRGSVAWLVVWIPIVGFLAAAAVLTYGLFSEGFGIRGAVRSLTLLDQRTHEAVTVAGRSLYAGLSPSELTPDPGTMVSPWVYSGVGLNPPFRVGEGGRISGAVLPSRTPTPFTTNQVGTARERLRFRRLEGGAFEVLAGPEFTPVGEAGSVLLHGPDGGWYRSDATGRLVGIAPGKGESELALFLMGLVGEPEADPTHRFRQRHVYYYRSGPDPSQEFWDGRTSRAVIAERDLRTWVLDAGLALCPPGSYVARVARVPSLDDLGLEVDYGLRHHVVLGVLAEEDVVE